MSTVEQWIQDTHIEINNIFNTCSRINISISMLNIELK